jgi:hypothetical protein
LEDQITIGVSSQNPREEPARPVYFWRQDGVIARLFLEAWRPGNQLKKSFLPAGGRENRPTRG